jgi:AraC-like DNA-binding protein
MKTISNAVASDVVSDLLDTVRVRTTIYCHSDMHAPWGFGVRAHGNPSFHVITQGSGWLELEGADDPIEAHAGDLVLLPRGPEHWLRDHPGSPTQWLDDILASPAFDQDQGTLHYGGDGDRTELVCGSFVLDGDFASPILRELPEVIHVRGAEGAPTAWVAATVDLVRTVTASEAPGAQAVLTRLADTMLMQALQIELAELAASDSADARALRDPQIGTAIHLIHTHPDKAWTVEQLATEVGYSRSAFASRFRELVGESPMGYVTRTRLGVAAALLERTSLSIGEIARRAGYSSQASFTRAFKRAFGIAPGAYRTRPAA